MLLLLSMLAPAFGATTLVNNTPAAVTLNATAGKVTQIVCPAKTRYLMFRFVAADGFVDYTGTDAAAKTANALTFDSGTWFTLRVPGSGTGTAKANAAVSLYLAHTDNSGVVQLVATSDGV